MGGAIEGRLVYCPPQAAALTGPQLMAILERFIADNPNSADKTYGLRALRRLKPCVTLCARLNSG